MLIVLIILIVGCASEDDKIETSQTAKRQEMILNINRMRRPNFSKEAGKITETQEIALRLSERIRENMRDMIQSWSWVPTWFNSLRGLIGTTLDGLNKRCTSQHREMPAAILFCTLIQAILTSGGQVTVPAPEFLQQLENHTVTQGRDVYFTCVVNHLSTYKVAWIKSDSKAILAIHTYMVAQNPRLSVTHNGHNTWMLHVSNVQKNDSGTYMCQINTDPMRSQMGNLEVVISPDILNDNDSMENGLVAEEGGSVILRCHATGVPPPTVNWKREDNRNIVLRHEGGREKEVLRSYRGNTLTLNHIQRPDMGPYLCIATNGVPPSVSKRFIVKVQFQPLIRVPNQLVAAPLNSDVPLQCQVEASPNAISQWMRDNGEQLIASDKYVMEESLINDYTFLRNLTIRSLEKKDFGSYVCTSSNLIGKAEGAVRLQELHLTEKSTTTTNTPRITDLKSRKPQQKLKKWRRPKGRKDDENGSDDRDFTTVPMPEMRNRSPTQILPATTSKPPPWLMGRNNAVLPFISDTIIVAVVILHLSHRP